MGDLEALIGQTKALMGDLIAKPKMTDKVLSKPPFRFLHDTITAVITTTGFGEGLYTAPEMDHANITDKDAKVAYLNKIFQLVGLCKGQPIDIRAIKVVSGLEPENTNMFLIALAECASDRDINNEQAVGMCLDGVLPGQGAPPRRSQGKGGFAAAESKSDHVSASAGSKMVDESKGSAPPRDDGAKMQPEVRIPPEMEAIVPDRGKSRGGTRGGKPNLAVADVGLSGGMGGAIAPKLDREIEGCDGSEAVTQALLGELITRPKLTEKLLSKPPFRFLHDVIMEVFRSTGFGTGLYTPEECDSANVSDKEQKINFLEKIIQLVGLQLNTLVGANPSKIIAGKDPQDTNMFLQLLAVAAKHIPDSSAAVRTVLGDTSGAAAASAPSAPAPSAVSHSKPAPQIERDVEKEVEERTTPKQSGRPDVEYRPQQREADNFAPSGSAGHNRDIMMADEKPSFQDNNAGGETGDGGVEDGEKRSSRPATAGRRPPRVKDGAKQLQSKDVAPAVKKTEGIIIDGQDDDDEIDEVPEESRLADDVGAEAKSSGAAAGGADSKLVKDIMSRQAEQEAAGRVNKAVEIEDEAKGSGGNEAGGSGIRLGRLKKTGLDKKGAVGTAGGASGFGETDLEKMRSSIQLLVQHTGPLGTCMDYIQEDVSLMTAELHKWEEDCRKYEAEYEEAKRKTRESLHPLKLELAEVNDQIFEVIAKISSAKATNARNDEKIQQILKLSATA